MTAQSRSSADCHPEKPNRGRGLCPACHARARRAGTLDQYPTRRPRCLGLAEDAAWVLECGCRCHQDGAKVVHGNGFGCPCGGLRTLAERLGVSRAALAKALQRARARGSVAA